MIASVKTYFYLNNGELYQLSEKKQNARQFLQQLSENIANGKTVKYSGDYSLQPMLQKVVSGYEKRQGTIHRVWECFLRVFSFVGLYLSDAQKIQHYADVIRNSPLYYQSSSLFVEDATSKLKRALLKESTDQMKVVNAKPKELLQTNPKLKEADKAWLSVAACALENHDVDLAKQTLLSSNIEKIFFRAEDFPIFCNTIAACLLRNDEKEVGVIINKSISCFLLDSHNSELCQNEIEKLVKKCSVAGKLHFAYFRTKLF